MPATNVKTCHFCGITLDNVTTGIVVLKHPKHVYNVEACDKCAQAAKKREYAEVIRARGIK